MSRRYEQFLQAGARMVTISTDSVDALEKYRVRTGAPFMMLSDAEKRVIIDYDLHNPSEREGIAVPAMVAVDRSGIVRYSNVQRKYVRIRNKKLLKELQDLNMK
jgi:peroxiredoxin